MTESARMLDGLLARFDSMVREATESIKDPRIVTLISRIAWCQVSLSLMNRCLMQAYSEMIANSGDAKFIATKLAWAIPILRTRRELEVLVMRHTHTLMAHTFGAQPLGPEGDYEALDHFLERAELDAVENVRGLFHIIMPVQAVELTPSMERCRVDLERLRKLHSTPGSLKAAQAIVDKLMGRQDASKFPPSAGTMGGSFRLVENCGHLEPLVDLAKKLGIVPASYTIADEQRAIEANSPDLGKTAFNVEEYLDRTGFWSEEEKRERDPSDSANSGDFEDFLERAAQENWAGNAREIFMAHGEFNHEDNSIVGGYFVWVLGIAVLGLPIAANGINELSPFVGVFVFLYKLVCKSINYLTSNGLSRLGNFAKDSLKTLFVTSKESRRVAAADRKKADLERKMGDLNIKDQDNADAIGRKRENLNANSAERERTAKERADATIKNMKDKGSRVSELVDQITAKMIAADHEEEAFTKLSWELLTKHTAATNAARELREKAAVSVREGQGPDAVLADLKAMLEDTKRASRKLKVEAQIRALDSERAKNKLKDVLVADMEVRREQKTDREALQWVDGALASLEEESKAIENENTRTGIKEQIEKLEKTRFMLETRIKERDEYAKMISEKETAAMSLEDVEAKLQALEKEADEAQAELRVAIMDVQTQAERARTERVPQGMITRSRAALMQRNTDAAPPALDPGRLRAVKVLKDRIDAIMEDTEYYQQKEAHHLEAYRYKFIVNEGIMTPDDIRDVRGDILRLGAAASEASEEDRRKQIAYDEERERLKGLVDQQVDVDKILADKDKANEESEKRGKALGKEENGLRTKLDSNIKGIEKDKKSLTSGAARGAFESDREARQREDLAAEEKRKSEEVERARARLAAETSHIEPLTLERSVVTSKSFAGKVMLAMLLAAVVVSTNNLMQISALTAFSHLTGAMQYTMNTTFDESLKHAQNSYFGQSVAELTPGVVRDAVGYANKLVLNTFLAIPQDVMAEKMVRVGLDYFQDPEQFSKAIGFVAEPFGLFSEAVSPNTGGEAEMWKEMQLWKSADPGNVNKTLDIAATSAELTMVADTALINTLYTTGFWEFHSHAAKRLSVPEKVVKRSSVRKALGREMFYWKEYNTKSNSTFTEESYSPGDAYYNLTRGSNLYWIMAGLFEVGFSLVTMGANLKRTRAMTVLYLAAASLPHEQLANWLPEMYVTVLAATLSHIVYEMAVGGHSLGSAITNRLYQRSGRMMSIYFDLDEARAAATPFGSLTEPMWRLLGGKIVISPKGAAKGAVVMALDTMVDVLMLLALSQLVGYTYAPMIFMMPEFGPALRAAAKMSYMRPSAAGNLVQMTLGLKLTGVISDAYGYQFAAMNGYRLGMAGTGVYLTFKKYLVPTVLRSLVTEITGQQARPIHINTNIAVAHVYKWLGETLFFDFTGKAGPDVVPGDTSEQERLEAVGEVERLEEELAVIEEEQEALEQKIDATREEAEKASLKEREREKEKEAALKAQELKEAQRHTKFVEEHNEQLAQDLRAGKTNLMSEKYLVQSLSSNLNESAVHFDDKERRSGASVTVDFGEVVENGGSLSKARKAALENLKNTIAVYLEGLGIGDLDTSRMEIKCLPGKIPGRSEVYLLITFLDEPRGGPKTTFMDKRFTAKLTTPDGKERVYATLALATQHERAISQLLAPSES